MTTRTRNRRRHAATGARIVAGTLSAAAALGLMGAMAGVAKHTGGNAPSAPAGTASAANPVVIAMPGSASSQVAQPAIAVAPRVVATSAPPVATSRGS